MSKGSKRASFKWNSLYNLKFNYLRRYIEFVSISNVKCLESTWKLLGTQPKHELTVYNSHLK
jgi:hypothetical protein